MVEGNVPLLESGQHWLHSFLETRETRDRLPVRLGGNRGWAKKETVNVRSGLPKCLYSSPYIGRVVFEGAYRPSRQPP